MVYAFDKNQHQPGVDVLINGMETLIILLTGAVTDPLGCNQQIVDPHANAKPYTNVQPLYRNQQIVNVHKQIVDPYPTVEDPNVKEPSLIIEDTDGAMVGCKEGRRQKRRCEDSNRLVLNYPTMRHSDSRRESIERCRRSST